ncbi:MAG: DUF3604 domain-containing protein [Micropepsaceae bacterium]
MRKIIIRSAAVLVTLALLVAVYWFGAQGGWFGNEQGPGTVEGKVIPPEVIKARESGRRVADTDDGVILFGDLHVHTTISADAFQSSLPLMGGSGVHPLADACDFARYCSALDFWASTDHAESITANRWAEIKKTVRACQKVSDGQSEPDMVSFIGFEWTQVGQTPAEHYGHKNVIFRDLDDDKVSARPIAATGAGGQSAMRRMAKPMSPLVPISDFSNRQDYFNYNKFMSITRDAQACDASTTSEKLPRDCMEYAPTPGDLVKRLVDEQKLNPLIIPHGSSWGMYTPAGSNWYKALDPRQRPEQFGLVEVYSGHGNSEEYRSWDEVTIDSSGKKSCPAPSPGYTPSCWRAGEIIAERCLKAGLGKDECDKRAATARQNYMDMEIAGHLTVPGETANDWRDAGQCTDCFLPAFNYRPKESVQAGLAYSHFDDKDGKVTRFTWGFIGSSDNHRARPGTGYKQYDRRNNTEAAGAANETALRNMQPNETWDDENPQPRSYTITQLLDLPGLRLVEFERRNSFLRTGGLAVVHAANRSREAIWDALQRRDTYATSGQKILLWFSAADGKGTRIPMGAAIDAKAAPTFTVKAAGAFKQKPGCPSFTRTGLDESRLNKLCAGECENPSDVRSKITRIEVVKIRPQKVKDENLTPLIQDRFIVHACEPSADGTCTFTFTDPSYATDGRDAMYYVKAIQEPEPMINADGLRCEKDASGKCVKVNICYGDYRSGKSDCLAPAEPRAWSSPIYLSFK